jgi:hypothetical protein
MGEGNTSVVRREVGDLLPPAHLVAAEAVGENQRGAAAGDFVVKVAERPLELGDYALHGARHPLLSRKASA